MTLKVCRSNFQEFFSRKFSPSVEQFDAYLADFFCLSVTKLTKWSEGSIMEGEVIVALTNL